MDLSAEQAVFWPNITEALEKVRSNCNTCNKIVPSQSNLPPVEPIIPDYPFQHVCADYLSLNGESYGVFVDRYSRWPGVIRDSTAMDFTKFLARLCEDYGCPEMITTDGGQSHICSKPTCKLPS